MSIAENPAGGPSWRYIQLWPGSKAAKVSGDAWREGLSWNEELAAGFIRREHDLGIRLDKSDLVVFDADVKGLFGIADGREELLEWAATRVLDWEPTLIIETSGRIDGTHVPGGWHVYYKQNSRWKIQQNIKLTDNCEVLVRGITRFTPDFRVLRDLPIAELPYEWARRLQSLPPPGRRYGKRDENFAEIGVNNALTALKGLLVGNGAWSESQADDVVRYANNRLDHPMDEKRLDDTVLRPKGWDHA